MIETRGIDVNATTRERSVRVRAEEPAPDRLRQDLDVEPEVTVKVAKLGCRVYEVPIRYYGRTYAEGKKITWRDGAAALYHIVRYRLFD